ncbi:DoxX family protein [Zavarzinia compransoris]|uniref:DoxX family protein n=1 Tax=Zavarzinia marina TaxID=2911065 RepID=UPI001F43CC22|nr:DoxX family protein [Zavarzinia marina]MCF4164769.1 DoxX family protein [Zavarzinia marina]
MWSRLTGLDAGLARIVGLERFAGIGDLVFRVLTAPIFIVGGLGHFVEHEQMLARIEGSPWLGLVRAIADPGLLLHLSGIVFVVFGILLALGLMTRLSALVLFVTLVPITLSIHIAPGHTGPLLKNVAILAALVHFFLRGGGAHALDRAPARPGTDPGAA